MADDSGPRADYGGDDVEIPGHVRVKCFARMVCCMAVAHAVVSIHRPHGLTHGRQQIAPKV